MANFASVENSIVLQVISVADADCAGGVLPQADIVGAEFITSLKIAGVWILTSITGEYRYNYAGIGYTYDTVRDAFIAPKPYPSWILDESTCQWEAPIPMPVPNSPPDYVWDEDTLSWVEVPF